MKDFDVLVGRGKIGYEVLTVNIPVNVFIRDLDKLENNFTDQEKYKVNRPKSNTILIAVKDGLAHLLAKDPDIKLAINNGSGIHYYDTQGDKRADNLISNSSDNKKINEINKPIEANDSKEIAKPQKKKGKVKVILDIPRQAERVEEDISEDVSKKTAEEQIEIIRKKVSYTIKSEIKHASLICGGTGLGKSFLVEDLLENEFHMRRDIHFITYKGSMTETGLFIVLSKNPSKIIILDDCDSVWKDDNAINLLKGGLDSTVPKVNKKGFIFEVTYQITEDEAEDTSDKEEFHMMIDNAFTEQECISLFNKKISQLEEMEEVTYIIKQIKKVEAEFIQPKRYISKVSKGKGKDYPVEFRGKLIFVSNQPKSSFDDAVKGRMTVSELNLTREETLVYVSKIAKHVVPHVKDLDFKMQVLEFFKDNPKIPFNLREYANAIDLAITMPNDWKQLVTEN